MKNKIILVTIIICIVIFASTIIIKKQNKTTTNTPDEIIGKWNTVSAVNIETGQKTENLRDVFGSSYSQYGSYLELKEDKTFIDALRPITTDNESTTGTYTIQKDENKKGDYYIYLTYNDGSKNKLEKVFLDNSNTPYLVLDNFINGYQLTLKKQV